MFKLYCKEFNIQVPAKEIPVGHFCRSIATKDMCLRTQMHLVFLGDVVSWNVKNVKECHDRYIDMGKCILEDD